MLSLSLLSPCISMRKGLALLRCTSSVCWLWIVLTILLRLMRMITPPSPKTMTFATAASAATWILRPILPLVLRRSHRQLSNGTNLMLDTGDPLHHRRTNLKMLVGIHPDLAPACMLHVYDD